MTYLRLLLVSCLAVLALGVPGSVTAGASVTQPLLGTVGRADAPNAFVIDLRDAAGEKISHLDPGTYTINVRDYATEHNFHLFGSGVDQTTVVERAETATWVVTLRNGTYRYQCDPHASSMRGSFTVGTVTTPPAAKKLTARVGPKRTISLRTASGARVKRLTAGRYRISVRDATSSDNFHLLARGVNKKTGVKARVTQTWNVTFRAGTVRYRSDAHRKLGGTFSVVAAG